MDEKTLLVSLLTKQFAKTEDEISALVFDKDGDNIKIKDNAADLLYSMDAQRISKIKDGYTEKFNDGYKKAQGEVLSKFEKDLRDKFGVNSDKTGLDLIEEVITVKAPKNPTKVNFDDLKKTPEFIEYERNILKSEQEKANEWKNKYENYAQQVEREKKLSKVYDRALDVLNKKNPVLPKNQEVAKNLQQAFLNTLNEYDYELGDAGIVVLKDGKRHENAHGHAINFDDLVAENAAKYFEFQVQSNKGGAGNQNNGKSSQFNGAVPKDMAELASMAAAIDADGTLSPEDKQKKKVELTRAYAASQGRPI